MFTVARLRRKPKQFHRFTGLHVDAFDVLLAAVHPVYTAREEARLGRADRRRAPGAGNRFALGVPERLLMVLMYHRLYTTEALLGFLFGLDPSNLNRERNHRMGPALAEVLPLPARDELGLVSPAEPGRGGKRIGTLEELLRRFPELEEVLIDATEQPVPQPQEKRARRQRYSGKKKDHTLKTQITATRAGVVLHATCHVPGSVHDYTLLRFSGVLYRLADGTVVRVDKGYEGVELAFPGLDLQKPAKAYSNQPLTVLGRVYNRMQSRLRIAVEHAFARLKQFRILAGTYRGQIARYDDCFGLVCGLNNYRLLGRLAW